MAPFPSAFAAAASPPRAGLAPLVKLAAAWLPLPFLAAVGFASPDLSQPPERPEACGTAGGGAAAAAQCEDEGGPGALQLLQRRAIAHRDAALKPGYVHTPRGPWREECVHELPEGSRWGLLQDGHSVLLTFADGSEQILPPCGGGGGSVSKQVEVEANLTWASDSAPDSFYQCESTEAHSRPMDMVASPSRLSRTLQSFTADYQVPGEPTTSNGQTLFWWIGVQPPDDSIVLQPVLSWGKEYNGVIASGWTFTSWNCCPGGRSLYSTPITGLQPAETVQAKIFQDQNDASSYWVQSCAKGSCSSLYASHVGLMDFPFVEFETFGVVSNCSGNFCANVDCSLLPNTAMWIGNIQISPPVTWKSQTMSRCFSLSQNCGWDVHTSQEGIAAYPPSVVHGNFWPGL